MQAIAVAPLAPCSIQIRPCLIVLEPHPIAWFYDGEQHGSIAKVKQKYCNVDLLIIDDFGIGELLPQICPVLLDIIDKQSSVGGLLITSQYPVAAWHGLFPEATIADTHHSL
ncbi:ATP-binding protein [Moraxella sp. ZY200743]|uniref:ATP-binding protein n=1 Tax=Moraxella sp. ZY200743 TaxID=2911970 RepID=UPI003D7D86F8